MLELFKKYFSKLFILVSLIIIVYRLLVGYLNSEEISENEGETTGIIVDYYRVGVDNVFLKYTYEIGGRAYDKTVSVSLVSRINDCEKTKECIGRKYVVYYSTKNPEKSEIDLDQEIE